MSSAGIGRFAGIVTRRLATFPRRQSQVRTMFNWRRNWDPLNDVRSMVRDMERTFEQLNPLIERPFRWHLPRALPLSATHESGSNTYRLNIDMNGFRPEDIKVSLKNRTLTIEGKMELKAEDGSRFYQETSREYLLPESLNVDALKSTLGEDGVLRIEGPLPEPEKPREIPINRQEKITGQQNIPAE